MPLDIGEGFAAAMKESALVNSAVAKLKTMTTDGATHTAVEWADAIGLSHDGVAFVAASTFDKVKGGHVSLADFKTIIGVTQDGLIGQQIQIIEDLIVDIND